MNETQQNQTNNSSAQPSELKVAGKEVKKKSVMLIASLALLITAAIFLTYAWYTKMSSISSLDFDVAQWDYRANYQSGEISVNVYDYTNVQKKKAAPGTEGFIPFVLNTDEAETDIDYVISVDKSALSPEFVKRLIFTYRNGDTTADYRRGYNRDNNTYSAPYSADTLIEFDSDHLLAGVIKYTEKTKEVNFYWRWVYDAKEAMEKNLVTKSDLGYSDATMSDANWALFKSYVQNGNFPETPETIWPDAKLKWEEFYTAWDEFDTRVGKYPDAFEDDMRAIVRVVGVQIVPEREQVPENQTKSS